MKTDVFSNISKIIERDSKTTTYKFALLRGVIDIIQDNSPFKFCSDGKVYFPTGLLIDKWLLYYYPILESSTNIPQINNSTSNLAFEAEFRKVIDAYRENGGFSAFNNDLRNKGIPQKVHSFFFALAKKLHDTITKMPMKYIGRSISDDYYSIFKFENDKKKSGEVVDIEYLINNFGSFSIPMEYYEAFQILGSFINGQDSILFKWAEFSVKASGKDISIEKVLTEVLKSPITERDIQESKKIYKSILNREGKVFCVWTGKSITSYDVDHLIPFSIWKNNDLWNLLPSNASINNKKRDKIPSVELIERQKDLILYYWELINQSQPRRFQKEIQVTLLGKNPFHDWQKNAIKQLQQSCEYLISNRGYEEWKI